MPKAEPPIEASLALLSCDSSGLLAPNNLSLQPALQSEAVDS